jgi:hypothetical protein
VLQRESLCARRTSLVLGFCIVILAILACSINVGGPAYPTPAIPVSTAAIGDLNQAVQTALASGLGSGEVTLVITEPELTSYLAYQLSTQTQPLITSPQVYLRNGQIQVYGTAHQGYFVATAAIVLNAGVDPQGQLLVDVASADFGPFPIPAGLKEAATAAIQEAYTGWLGPVATGFRLESITVADGNMTVTGRIK